MRISLCDGRDLELDHLSARELTDLQWEQERLFAARIVAAPKGSEERQRITEVGYASITSIQLRIAFLEHPQVGKNGLSDVSHVGGRRAAELILSLLAHRKKESGRKPFVFDIGCGAGETLSQINRCGYRVGGLEPCSNLFQLARARLPEEDKENLFSGSLFNAELDNLRNRVDVIFWESVMEHIPVDEVLQYMRRAYEMLCPGGVCVTLVPNWHIRPMDITRLFKGPRSEAEGFHMKEYTMCEVVDLLTQVGYKRIYTPLCILPRWGDWLVGNGLIGLKQRLEPALEYVPFKLATFFCNRLALDCTIAVKPETAAH
jgi:SAM-dependent methyltransferase